MVCLVLINKYFWDINQSKEATMFLIIDDNPDACERLKFMLGRFNGIANPLRAESDPFKAREIIKSQSPELLFLDIEMPGLNGFDLWESVRLEGFTGHVICTTVHNSFILKALRERALDYLMKPIMEDELAEALQRYAEQKIEQSKNIARLKEWGLSDRQLEILELIFQGYTSEGIGKQLCLSKHTVDTHRRNILRMTQCRNTAEIFKLF